MAPLKGHSGSAGYESSFFIALDFCNHWTSETHTNAFPFPWASFFFLSFEKYFGSVPAVHVRSSPSRWILAVHEASSEDGTEKAG